MAFTVTNTSQQDVTDVSGQTDNGSVTCSDTELAPGETATCTGRIVPEEGAQSTPVSVSATTADGARTTASRPVYLSGVAVKGVAAPVAQAPAAQAPAVAVGGHTSMPSTGGAKAGVASVILGGVPAPTGLQQVIDPAAGAYPMPLGGVGTGGGGMADVRIGNHEQDGDHDVYAWLLLLAGAGAVSAQRVRTSRSR
ncbi:hypothetical protein EPD65_11385 [Nocardioides jejuensis]|uniref:Uncharacterized protein n=1 Tax=Nocardioides jejuensis TaxID=2502782 RepID=A0A4R1BZM4_9ACTN|nr:hypothetical protein EPD65_11385 [Nocardioides jejuensis]